MARRKLHLRTFVASPSDLAHVRSTVIDSFESLQNELRHDNIVMEAIDYRDLLLEPGNPQEAIDPHIDQCDLLLILLGSRAGEGTIHEFEHGLTLFESGRIRNVMVLFLGVQHGDDGAGVPADATVQTFRASLERRRIYYYAIPSIDLLGESLTDKLRQFVTEQRESLRWVSFARGVCEPDQVKTMRILEDPFSEEMLKSLRMIEQDPSKAAAQANRAYDRYVRTGELESETDALLVAHHLYIAIEQNQDAPMAPRQFYNPIHQQLSRMIRDTQDLDRRARIVARLIDWLRPQSKRAPTARNFAAFVLGMLRDRSAEEPLLKAVENDREEPAVRYYAAVALGTLRRNTSIKRLGLAAAKTTSHELRMAISYSILHISGEFDANA